MALDVADPVMNEKHPLAIAAERWLGVATGQAIESARSLAGSPALLHREHLQLETSFSGMGGGELASYLVGNAVGIEFHRAHAATA